VNEKLKILIEKLNATWRPTLAWIVVVSTMYVYILFPIAYAIGKIYDIDLEIPKIIIDNLNNLLLTGGLIAGLRTAEKYFNVTDKH